MSTKDTAQLKIRLPSELLQWLKDAAERNSRSMSGELVHLIKQARTMEERK